MKHAKHETRKSDTQDEAHMLVVDDVRRNPGRQACAVVSRRASVPYGIFVGVVLLVLILPLVGMTVAPTTTTTENTTMAPWPDAIQDGALNTQYLQQAGDYFEDHYAGRNQMITADSLLRSGVFGVSNTDQAIVGSNGWLYYTGSLDDYLGTAQLSDQELDNISYNLSIMQRYAASFDSKFVFTLAPNKNTLYPQNMPANYLQSTEAHNAQRLEQHLQAYEVNYVNLFEAFEERGKVMYFDRDTHWNNEGALLVYDKLMDAVALPNDTYEQVQLQTRTDYVGDLGSMVYPTAAQPEENAYLVDAPQYSYIGAKTSVEDDFIQTSAPNAPNTETLVMFRDSFGNSLVPLFAPQFEQAYFSQLVPFNVALAAENGAGVIIVERAERHLYQLGNEVPVVPAAQVNIQQTPATSESSTTVSLTANGSYVMVQGALDAACVSENLTVLVGIGDADGTEAVYQAFRMNVDENGKANSGGYCMYLSQNSVPADMIIKVYTVKDGNILCVQQSAMHWEG